jgi:3-oxoacyl-[acyl-carrier protein] reductase
MKTHENRVAIVTGAAQGIGQQIAVRLAERGAKLVLLDIKDCDETLGLIGTSCPDALTIKADVRLREDWDKAGEAVQARFGRADILVNNAGIYPFGTIDELTFETWRDVMATNLDAHFFAAKVFVPIMRAQGWGRIVNISSNSIGANQIGGLSHYIASKAGVVGFVRGLANDVAAYGITVNAVAPAATLTPGTSGAPPEAMASIWRTQAIKRQALPDDIVGPVLFLSSEDAQFVTGQLIVVDGGLFKH